MQWHATASANSPGPSMHVTIPKPDFPTALMQGPYCHLEHMLNIAQGSYSDVFQLQNPT